MILTLGPGGSGLTFLNWSIVFLRGDTTYTNIDNISTQVNDNPLLGLTAHGFCKDHIYSSNNLCRLKEGTKKSVVYITLTCQDDFNYIAMLNCKKIVFSCQGRGRDLLARMATLVPGNAVPDLLDHLSIQFGHEQAKATLLSCNKLFTDYYSVPQPSDEYFVINYEDMFENLNKRIEDMFLFLGESIDPARWSTWLDIYAVYRERNANILTDFAPQTVDVSSTVQLQILKEILKWKSGSSLRK